MTFTLYNAILCVICCLISAVTQMLAACVVLDRKPSWHAYGCFATTLTVHALLAVSTGLKETILIMPVSLIFAILPFILLFQLRGWPLISKFLIYYGLLIAGETVIGIIWSLFQADVFMEAMSYYTHPICIPGQFILGAGVLLVTWLYGFMRHARQNRESLMLAGRILRIVLLLSVIIAFGGAYPSLYHYHENVGRFGDMLALYFAMPALILLGATYLIRTSDTSFCITRTASSSSSRTYRMPCCTVPACSTTTWPTSSPDCKVPSIAVTSTPLTNTAWTSSSAAR